MLRNARDIVADAATISRANVQIDRTARLKNICGQIDDEVNALDRQLANVERAAAK
jgi:hypothetical protein